MSLLDWFRPRKLASPRRTTATDPAAELIRDLVATQTPMSLATLKAASDAAAGGTKKAERSPSPVAPRLPPVSRCAIPGIGVTPVF